jgi:hypothetical protein
MAALRWIRSEASNPPSPMKLRWVRSEASGAAAASPKLRWIRSEAGGALAVIVAPITSQSGLEPETVVTISASLVGGGTADSWTWRPVSGASVGINGTGATVTVAAPSDINGASTVIGVRATKDGITSPEATMVVQVLPQTEWLWAGSSWLPNVVVWL